MIELAQHIVEHDHGCGAGGAPDEPHLRKLARQHDASLLPLRRSRACGTPIQADLDIVAMGSNHGDTAREVWIEEALRPARMIGGAFAKPAATVAAFQMVAPLFGKRITRWVRIATVAYAVYRIVRSRRSED